MLLEIYNVQTQYSRTSNRGTVHTYFRTRKMARLLCDSCQATFERPVGQMDYRRLTQDHTHICSKCDTKRFAQSKGVESRRFWNTTVDRDIDIDSL